jgi:hypothetical protein
LNKQSLTKDKKVEVVQGCVGDNFAQIIVVTYKVSRIESKQHAAALELYKSMKQAWCIKGHNNDNEEDNDVDNNSMVETSLGTVKDKQSLVKKHRRYECRKTGLRSAKCPNKKKKDKRKRLAL